MNLENVSKPCSATPVTPGADQLMDLTDDAHRPGETICGSPEGLPFGSKGEAKRSEALPSIAKR